MAKYTRSVVVSGLVMAWVVGIATTQAAVEPDVQGWDAKAAAKYLDSRAEWWSTWPNAARDRGTFCISCHTTLPYAIARPALRGRSVRRGPSAAESKIVGNLLTRARNWRDIEPFYPDQTRGIPKTSESRAIESGDERGRAVAPRRGGRHAERRYAHGARRDVVAADEDRPEHRRVDLAELQLRPVGITELAVLRRVARRACGRLGAGRLCRHARDPGQLESACEDISIVNTATVSVLNQLMGLWASARVPGPAD